VKHHINYNAQGAQKQTPPATNMQANRLTATAP
jgi:hypothetical protein